VTKAGPFASGRLKRTVRSLIAISLVGVSLAGYSIFALRRDIQIATSPISEDQHHFFVDAASRPDVALFFKNLTPDQKLVMAKRIGAYEDSNLLGLISQLLGTFDEQARKELTNSLTILGAKFPEKLAEQLKTAGSLQQLSIVKALRTVGPHATPFVAKQFSVADARPNASSYLVSLGPESIPVLLPILADKDKDVRLSAADALGKLGARAAVATLVSLYRSSTGDEQAGYLSAIAGIGDPSTEPLLTSVTNDQTLATPRRAQAMLGLGRIGTRTAVSVLWSLATADDAELHSSMISGLQLGGIQSLKYAPTIALGLEVAQGIFGGASDLYISQQLKAPECQLQAAKAARYRPKLVGVLTEVLKKPSPGEVIDACFRTLSTTDEGRNEIMRFSSDPILGGFATRSLGQYRLIGQSG
jgi:HEAT repeats